jgi:hypothetical protein
LHTNKHRRPIIAHQPSVVPEVEKKLDASPDQTEKNILDAGPEMEKMDASRKR